MSSHELVVVLTIGCENIGVVTEEMKLGWPQMMFSGWTPMIDGAFNGYAFSANNLLGNPEEIVTRYVTRIEDKLGAPGSISFSIYTRTLKNGNTTGARAHRKQKHPQPPLGFQVVEGGKMRMKVHPKRLA